MTRIMVTTLNVDYKPGPTHYEIAPSAHAAITALGYQLKPGLQPEADQG